MSDRVKMRDLVESLAGLRNTAADLSAAAKKPTLEGTNPPAVLVPAGYLINTSVFLDQVCDELKSLLPDSEVDKVTE